MKAPSKWFKESPGPLCGPGFFLLLTVAVVLLVLPVSHGHSQTKSWLGPEEIGSKIEALAKANPAKAALHTLTKSYGGTPYRILEIGTETGSSGRTHPAILVVANPEGTSPLGSEAALYLADLLLKSPDRCEKLTWYILASANPDGASRFFRKPLAVDGRNLRPWNDDQDEQTDEDGAEDLNGDGLITQMRVKDPEGTMIPDDKDARLMKRADPLKSEKGIYKLYPEGLDNDNDGQYNEDGPGGTNIGITFPFLYPAGQPGSGAWSGSEAETYSLMEFMTAHPEIAMTMTYGSTNFCLVPPRGGRKSAMNLSAIRLPQRYAQMLNADTDKTYSLEEVKEMLKAVVPPGTTVDDAMVAGMLEMGAVVNPPEADAKLYSSLADAYKKYLKEKGWTAKRADPQREKDGTFELWSYYQLGLPSFSQDLWAVPKPKDSLKNAFLAYNDSILSGQGFVAWKEYDHPKLGKVEIGGIVPYADLIPDPSAKDSLLNVQVPWIFELVRHIPELNLEEVKTVDLGAGVYRIDAWVRNNQKFPFPLAIGQRTRVIPPAIVTLTGNGITFVSGRARVPLENLGGYEQRKLTWIVRTGSPTEVRIQVTPVNAFGSEKTFRLGGKEQ